MAVGFPFYGYLIAQGVPNPPMPYKPASMHDPAVNAPNQGKNQGRQCRKHDSHFVAFAPKN